MNVAIANGSRLMMKHMLDINGSYKTRQRILTFAVNLVDIQIVVDSVVDLRDFGGG